MQQDSVIHASVSRVEGTLVNEFSDILAVEEPLEIRISYHDSGSIKVKNISVTMRTPGNDMDLAVGFLFTEGIISGKNDVIAVAETKLNTLLATLGANVRPNINQLERNFYTTSSCGVCGKASIGAVTANCPEADSYPYDNVKILSSVLCSLPQKLRGQQSVFDQTGGIHACALFNPAGELLMMREDVGRHNALDKLVGATLSQGLMPLNNHLLLLSGRASFELLQKAAVSGIKVVAAVGAPSSLAVQMAEEWNITLIGFLRGERFNIYSGAQRIVI